MSICSLGDTRLLRLCKTLPIPDENIPKAGSKEKRRCGRSWDYHALFIKRTDALRRRQGAKAGSGSILNLQTVKTEQD